MIWEIKTQDRTYIADSFDEAIYIIYRLRAIGYQPECLIKEYNYGRVHPSPKESNGRECTIPEFHQGIAWSL